MYVYLLTKKPTSRAKPSIVYTSKYVSAVVDLSHGVGLFLKTRRLNCLFFVMFSVRWVLLADRFDISMDGKSIL